MHDKAEPKAEPLRNCILFLYLSGHGAQIDARAVFAPIDVDFSSREKLLATSIDIAELIDRVEKVSAVNVVVMDISRNDVFSTPTVAPLLSDGDRKPER